MGRLARTGVDAIAIANDVYNEIVKPALNQGQSEEKKVICDYCKDTIPESEKNMHPQGAKKGFKEVD